MDWYLCVSQRPHRQHFVCSRFSEISAQDIQRRHIEVDVYSVLMPVPSWLPRGLHASILEYKLARKIFVKVVKDFEHP
jgi:hypothetical protein